MGTVRKRHGAVFKGKVALEALKGQRTMTDLARAFGVHPMQISKWKKLLVEGLPGIFSKGHDGEANHRELIDRLYRQIGEQKVELDWLKKKSGLFC